MRGMCEIVEWSIRDETTHVNGMTQLFHAYCKEHPRVVADKLKISSAEKAVELEGSLIDLVYNHNGAINACPLTI